MAVLKVIFEQLFWLTVTVLYIIGIGVVILGVKKDLTDEEED